MINSIHNKVIKASPVEINTDSLKTELGIELVNKLNFKNIEATSIVDSKKYVSLIGGSEKEDESCYSGDVMNSNHFINMLSTAFNLHKSIVLSPDDFWLLICQGFTNCVKNNPKYFKGKFTKSESKIKVSINRDDFSKGGNNNWENIFPEFMTQIDDKIKTDLVSIINSDFSTSKSQERIAFSISLMDSLSSYIDYEVQSLCGIPEIEILGTIEDYQSIKNNLNDLKKYNIEWWLDELTPIIDSIIETLKGKNNLIFWESIFKENSMSGGSSVDGWITKFFPYIKETEFKKTIFGYKTRINIIKNPLLNSDRKCHIKIGDFPNGISSIDFKWICLNSSYKMKFTSGFIGITEEAQTNRLKSEINWIVAES